ncbi:MAG: heme-binding protein [Acidimicrobiia bacterium]|nr:heme-binding protein [Acidimicrobiia bacterium]
MPDPDQRRYQLTDQHRRESEPWLGAADGPHRRRATAVGRPVVFGGGVGIFTDGQLVGAIVVSGETAAEDTEVAEAGAAAIP